MSRHNLAMSRIYLAVLAALLALLPCCVRATEGSQLTVHGRVLSQDGQPVANATIASLGLYGTAQSDANGAFTLSLSGEIAKNGITASAANFASQTKVLHVGAGTTDVTEVWTLHPVDLVTTIKLPEPGEPPVNVTVTRDDGAGVNIALPAGGVVDANGAVASGNVTVSVTYWDPITDLGATPGDLQATPPPGSVSNTSSTVGLTSFGMTTITVLQNDQPLSIAPNANIVATFSLPGTLAQAAAALRAELAMVIASRPQDVGFWQFNRGSGLWNMTASMQSPSMLYSAGDNLVQGYLLSFGVPLNLDSILLLCKTSTAHSSGDACDHANPCCPSGGSGLACLDGICVPLAD